MEKKTFQEMIERYNRELAMLQRQSSTGEIYDGPGISAMPRQEVPPPAPEIPPTTPETPPTGPEGGEPVPPLPPQEPPCIPCPPRCV